jgi:hypothetical protein
MIIDNYSLEGGPTNYMNMACEIWPNPGELRTLCPEPGFSDETATQPFGFVTYGSGKRFVFKYSSPTSSIPRNLPEFYWKIYKHSVNLKRSIQDTNETIIEKPVKINASFLFGKVFKKIGQITKLGKNWDSFGSHPIEMECIKITVRILLAIIEWQESINLDIPAPFVVPTPDGGIQFEWKNKKKYLEIAMLPNISDVEFLAIEKVAEGDLELEGVIKSDNEIKELLHWLVSGSVGSLKKYFDKASLLKAS